MAETQQPNLALASRRSPNAGRFRMEPDRVQQELQEANNECRATTESQDRNMHSASRWWLRFLKETRLSMKDNHISSEAAVLWVVCSLGNTASSTTIGGKSFVGAGYSLFTFRDTYMPAFFRWCNLSGLSYEPNLPNKMRIKIKDMVAAGALAPSQLPSQKGENPICHFDVEYVVKHDNFNGTLLLLCHQLTS